MRPDVPRKFEGGVAPFKLSAKATLTMPTSAYLVGQGLGCAGGDPLFDAATELPVQRRPVVRRAVADHQRDHRRDPNGGNGADRRIRRDRTSTTPAP